MAHDAEVVCYAAGEAPDRLHLLGLPELALQAGPDFVAEAAMHSDRDLVGDGGKALR